MNKKRQCTLAVGLVISVLFANAAFAADAPAAKKVVKPGTFCDIQDNKACQDAVTPAMIGETATCFSGKMFRRRGLTFPV